MDPQDYNNLWSEGAKRTIELYVESSERLARALLDFHERSTTWARDTMLGPIFEAQRVTGRHVLDSSLDMTRKLYRLDDRKPA
jgi:hypothetical protein